MGQPFCLTNLCIRPHTVPCGFAGGVLVVLDPTNHAGWVWASSQRWLQEKRALTVGSYGLGCVFVLMLLSAGVGFTRQESVLEQQYAASGAERSLGGPGARADGRAPAEYREL
eukprot:SAG22_NODE_1547_length_4151_cov_3.067868_2_plen_113_part_00